MGIRSKPANKNWYKNYPFKKKKVKGGIKSYKWTKDGIVEIETHKPKLRELI